MQTQEIVLKNETLFHLKRKDIIRTFPRGMAMFQNINERLAKTKDNQRKKQKYEMHIERLTDHLREEGLKKEQLQIQLEKEKEDVKKLEGFSLTNIFYTITGQKLEKLDKEQQEVLAAKLKYTEAIEAIDDMNAELIEYKGKWQEVADADVQYKSLLKEKERMIHSHDEMGSKRLFDLANEEAEVHANLKEFEEAIEVGSRTVRAFDQALDSLSSSKSWSTFDMFGGGALSTAMKHSHLDQAKSAIHIAQRLLRQFQEELLDIDNHFSSQHEIGNLLTFADYFFDGIIVDWVVHGKINDSYDETEKTKRKVQAVLHQIRGEKDVMQKKLQEIEKKRMQIFER